MEKKLAERTRHYHLWYSESGDLEFGTHALFFGFMPTRIYTNITPESRKRIQRALCDQHWGRVHLERTGMLVNYTVTDQIDLLRYPHKRNPRL